MKRLWSVVFGVLFLGVAVATSATAADAKKPAVIRIGTAFTAGNSRPFSLQTIGVLHQQGLLEEEFKKDGIKIEWVFFKGVSPAVNEAFANDTIDIGATSELGAIIAKAGGLKIKLIASGSTRGNSYLAVPIDSPAEKVEDLKGAKLATSNATNFQLAFERILQLKGLTHKDFKAYNLGPADGVAALASKDINGAVYGTQLFAPRRLGLVKIIYSTRDDFPDKWKSFSGIFVTEKFAKDYPEVTERFLKVFAKAARWASDENNREAYFLAQAKTGTPVNDIREDAEGTLLSVKNTPLIDDFVIGHFRDTIQFALERGLIRKAFDVNSFIDASFLEAALKDEGLEHFWSKYDAEGKETSK